MNMNLFLLSFLLSIANLASNIQGSLTPKSVGTGTTSGTTSGSGSSTGTTSGSGSTGTTSGSGSTGTTSGSGSSGTTSGSGSSGSGSSCSTSGSSSGVIQRGNLVLTDATTSGGDLSKITEASYYYHWKYPDAKLLYDQNIVVTKQKGFIVAVNDALYAKSSSMPDRCIAIVNKDNNISVVVKVADKCLDCQSMPSRISLSNVAFNELVGGACAAESFGAIRKISLRWVQCPTDDQLGSQLSLKPTIDEAYKKCNGDVPKLPEN